MEWLVPVVVAIIGGPVVVILQQLRKENTAQHAEARSLLERVADKVDKVDDKLTGHIDWHLNRTKTGRKTNGSKKEN